jgi:hypothetical protein
LDILEVVLLNHLMASDLSYTNGFVRRCAPNAAAYHHEGDTTANSQRRQTSLCSSLAAQCGGRLWTFENFANIRA